MVSAEVVQTIRKETREYLKVGGVTEINKIAMNTTTL